MHLKSGNFGWRARVNELQPLGLLRRDCATVSISYSYIPDVKKYTYRYKWIPSVAALLARVSYRNRRVSQAFTWASPNIHSCCSFQLFFACLLRLSLDGATDPSNAVTEITAYILYSIASLASLVCRLFQASTKNRAIVSGVLRVSQARSDTHFPYCILHCIKLY